jgi:hypothetical protein
MSLDERLREASEAARSIELSAPAIGGVRRRSNRRRALLTGSAVVALVIGGAVAWPRSEPTHRAMTEQPTDPPGTTNPALSPTTPPATGSGQPSSPGDTALVEPIPFGTGSLVFLPGAWGNDALTTVANGIVTVRSGDASAQITDLGASTSGVDADVDNASAAIADVPRLGPYGPRADVSTDGEVVVVSADVDGRRVEVRAEAFDAGTLLPLLRSVTTAARAAPIVASDETVAVADVVGLDYRDATRQLLTSGVRVEWLLDTTSTDVQIGTVVAMEPASGTTALEGSRVVLTVQGPATSLRQPGAFVPVSGSSATPSSPGFIDLVRPTVPSSGGDGAAPDATEAVQTAQRVPIVFLRGELVGFWSQDDPAFQGGLWLTDLTDPSFRVTPEPPVPATTTPPPLTQTAGLDDVAVDVPADWSIVRDGCPAARTAVVGSAPTDCAQAAGPWIGLQRAPDALTPCKVGGIGTADGGSMRVCWISNLADGITDVFVLLGSRIQVTTVAASGSSLPAIIDSLRAPRSTGQVATDDSVVARAVIGAFRVGRCDLVEALLAPGSTTVTACEAGDLTAVPDRLDTSAWMVALPTIQPDDQTRNASTLTVDGQAWHIEIRSFYDPATDDVTTLVTQVVDPAGATVIGPA